MWISCNYLLKDCKKMKINYLFRSRQKKIVCFTLKDASSLMRRRFINFRNCNVIRSFNGLFFSCHEGKRKSLRWKINSKKYSFPSLLAVHPFFKIWTENYDNFDNYDNYDNYDKKINKKLNEWSFKKASFWTVI